MRHFAVRLGTLAILVGVQLGTPVSAAADWTKFQTVGLYPGDWFDTMEVFIVGDTGAGPFQTPGISGLNQPGWSASLVNPGYVVASGPATQGLAWDFHFAGDMNETVSLDTLLWQDGVYDTLTFASRYDYVNGSMANLNERFDPPYSFLQHPDGIGYDRSVPEPSAVCLWASGLAGMLLMGWRRRNGRM